MTDPFSKYDASKIHPALVKIFPYAFIKSALLLRSRFSKALEPYDATPQHYGLLKVLKNSGPTNQIQIGDELGIDKTTMVRIIDHLEGKKLVERVSNPKDRRQKFIKISAAGHRLLAKLKSTANIVEAEFFSRLSKKDQETLRRIIFQLLP